MRGSFPALSPLWSGHRAPPTLPDSHGRHARPAVRRPPFPGPVPQRPSAHVPTFPHGLSLHLPRHAQSRLRRGRRASSWVAAARSCPDPTGVSRRTARAWMRTLRFQTSRGRGRARSWPQARSSRWARSWRRLARQAARNRRPLVLCEPARTLAQPAAPRSASMVLKQRPVLRRYRPPEQSGGSAQRAWPGSVAPVGDPGNQRKPASRDHAPDRWPARLAGRTGLKRSAGAPESGAPESPGPRVAFAGPGSRTGPSAPGSRHLRRRTPTSGPVVSGPRRPACHFGHPGPAPAAAPTATGKIHGRPTTDWFGRHRCRSRSFSRLARPVIRPQAESAPPGLLVEPLPPLSSASALRATPTTCTPGSRSMSRTPMVCR